MTSAILLGGGFSPAVSTYTQTYSTANRTVANPTAVAPAALTATAIAAADATDDATVWALANELKIDYTALLADVTAIRAEVVKVVADDLDNRQSVTAIVDDLQAHAIVI